MQNIPQKDIFRRANFSVNADMFRNHVQEARTRFNCEKFSYIPADEIIVSSVGMVPSCYRTQLGFGAQRTTAAAAEEKMADFVFQTKISRFILKMQLPRIWGFMFFSLEHIFLPFKVIKANRLLWVRKICQKGLRSLSREKQKFK
jgi:hypothetical protein